MVDPAEIKEARKSLETNVLTNLPVYLTGGENVSGFSHILGHALCLLYVARHGLKESELWAILAKIPANQIGDKSTSRVDSSEEEKALIGVCAFYREQFFDVWKTADNFHTNRLSTHKLLAGNLLCVD